jgi:sulfotransferase
MKPIHFIAGLPRSGSTLLTTVLNQNPSIHGQAVSSLTNLVANVHANWMAIEQNNEYYDERSRINTLRGIVEGFYRHVEKPVIIDKDRGWVSMLPLMESVLERPIKIIVCVRNPAEILTSFEKLRKENPMFVTRADNALGPTSSIATRAYYYAGPDGPLGLAHRHLQDSVIMGHLDRMLFVDYNRYCSNPKSQTKRIYDFLEIPEFDHDFENLVQTETFNDHAVGLPSLHKVKPRLEKTTVNCVAYLGLDLFEQYNREIFWNAWI